MKSRTVKPLRIGTVPYLNALPLVRPLDEMEGLQVLRDDPPGLRDRLLRGTLDVALLSSIEWLRRRDALTYVRGPGICCDGPVDSVRLYTKCDLDRIESVALDRHSLTGNALARVLLEQAHGIRPRYRPFDATPDGWRRARTDAAVVIGDRGLAFGHARFVDLGAEWKQWTGLPFVFALWIRRKGHPQSRLLDRTLRAAARTGLRQRPRIAKEAASRLNLDPQRCLRYLRDRIRYRVGPRERAGLAEFHKCLKRLDS